MPRRIKLTRWASSATRRWSSLVASQARTAARLVHAAQPRASKRRAPTVDTGHWVLGHALGTAGSRRYRLYRPPAVAASERLPMLVMLHGCGQNAQGFATSTQMNALARKHRFLVLYPEQDRLANPQGCWNWFETRTGRAQAEAASIVHCVDEVLRLYPVDPQRVALAGLSAGASLAALLATRHAQRFSALCMHSGVAPGAARSTATALGAMRGARVAPALLAQHLPPLLIVHGRDDTVVSIDNARATAVLWADSQSAQAQPARRLQRGQRYPMEITDYRCGPTLVVRLCQVQGLGHAWSGGRAGQPHSDPKGPDASRLVCAFIARTWEAAPGQRAAVAARLPASVTS